MREDPHVDDNLRRLAKAYFSRLTSRPTPSVHLDELMGARRRGSRWVGVAAGLASFIVVAGFVSFVTLNHRLAPTAGTGAQSPLASPAPTPPGCQGSPGVTAHPMDRSEAVASVSGEVKAEGGTVSSIVAKLMTYNTYLAAEAPGYHFNGVVVPGQSPGPSMQLESPNPSQVAGMSIHADDPVWVVAFSGTWFPQGSRGGLGASPSGIIVISAKVGLPVQYEWFADAWPPGFDALPDARSLPCVPS
jgi:hypothetical protein